MLFSNRSVSRTKLVATIASTFVFTLILSSCGGGGGSSAPQTTTPVIPTTPTVPTTPVAAMGCGTVTSTGTGNSTQVVVDGFPCGVAGSTGVNWPQVPYVSVKICAPGSTTNCQIIDHIILDTGSTGLRIANSAISSTLRTALAANAGSAASTTLTECEQYVDSFVYGPVVNADVYIAGESAKGTTMQVFGDTSFTVPTTCSNSAGTKTDTVQTFGGNGLLGVSFSTLDNYSYYFDCNNSSLGNCAINYIYPGLPNTVTQFGADSNGVTVTLPAVGAAGSLTAVVGTLNFGVGTQTNNTPTSNVLTLINDGNDQDQTFGTFAVQVAGASWSSAYIDSGTDTVYFNDPANTLLINCPSTPVYYSGFYCPASAQNVSFNYSNFGSTTTLATVPYSVINPNSLNQNIVAFDNEAGYISSSNNADSEIALGLSTFYGHTNYVIFAGLTAPGTGFGGSAATTVTGPINAIK